MMGNIQDELQEGFERLMGQSADVSPFEGEQDVDAPGLEAELEDAEEGLNGICEECGGLGKCQCSVDYDDYDVCEQCADDGDAEEDDGITDEEWVELEQEFPFLSPSEIPLRKEIIRLRKLLKGF